MTKVFAVPRIVVGVLVMQLFGAAEGADVGQVRWHQDVKQAWQETQKQGRPLLVFVTRSDCIPCAKMKVYTYADRRLVAMLNERFVPLTVDGAIDSPLLRDLAVKGVPATFVISPKAVILARFDGFLSADELMGRLGSKQEPTSGPAKPASPKPAVRSSPLIPVAAVGRAF